MHHGDEVDFGSGQWQFVPSLETADVQHVIDYVYGATDQGVDLLQRSPEQRLRLIVSTSGHAGFDQFEGVTPQDQTGQRVLQVVRDRGE